MKRILLISLISFVTLFCSGCVKFSYNIEIDGNGNVSVSQTKSTDFKFLKNDKIKEILQPDFEKVISNYTEQGYDVEISGDENYDCITLSKSGLRLINLTKNLPDGFIKESSSVDISKGIVMTAYRIHLVYDIKKALEANGLEYNNFKKDSKAFSGIKIKDPVIYKTIADGSRASSVILKTVYASGNSIITSTSRSEADEQIGKFKTPAELVIKIPGKAVEHNADEVISSNEYKWLLTDFEQPVEIILEYKKSDFSMLAAVLSLLLLGGALYAFVRKIHNEDVVKGL